MAHNDPLLVWDLETVGYISNSAILRNNYILLLSDLCACLHVKKKWRRKRSHTEFFSERFESEEIRQGQKVINEMITCLYKPNGDHT